MARIKRAIGLLAFLFLLLGLPQPTLAQTVAGERVTVQVAGLV
jgi:hypothetical protein